MSSYNSTLNNLTLFFILNKALFRRIHIPYTIHLFKRVQQNVCPLSCFTTSDSLQSYGLLASPPGSIPSLGSQARASPWSHWVAMPPFSESLPDSEIKPLSVSPGSTKTTLYSATWGLTLQQSSFLLNLQLLPYGVGRGACPVASPCSSCSTI